MDDIIKIDLNWVKIGAKTPEKQSFSHEKYTFIF